MIYANMMDVLVATYDLLWKIYHVSPSPALIPTLWRQEINAYALPFLFYILAEKKKLNDARSPADWERPPPQVVVQETKWTVFQGIMKPKTWIYVNIEFTVSYRVLQCLTLWPRSINLSLHSWVPSERLAGRVNRPALMQCRLLWLCSVNAEH